MAPKAKPVPAPAKNKRLRTEAQDDSRKILAFYGVLGNRAEAILDKQLLLANAAVEKARLDAECLRLRSEILDRETAQKQPLSTISVDGMQGVLNETNDQAACVSPRGVQTEEGQESDMRGMANVSDAGYPANNVPYAANTGYTAHGTPYVPNNAPYAANSTPCASNNVPYYASQQYNACATSNFSTNYAMPAPGIDIPTPAMNDINTNQTGAPGYPDSYANTYNNSSTAAIFENSARPHDANGAIYTANAYATVPNSAYAPNGNAFASDICYVNNQDYANTNSSYANDTAYAYASNAYAPDNAYAGDGQTYAPASGAYGPGSAL